MVFVTDMLKDGNDMVNVYEISYLGDGEDLVDSIFEQLNEPPRFGGSDYCDSRVVKIAGEDDLGYYLSVENTNRDYICDLFESAWGYEDFNPAFLKMIKRKVPSYTITLMGWDVPVRLSTTETVKRTRILDYAQMALAIEATNWPDITYYEDILEELAADGELPDLEDVEGPEEWEAYLNTLDKWVDSHLKVKAY